MGLIYPISFYDQEKTLMPVDVNFSLCLSALLELKHGCVLRYEIWIALKICRITEIKAAEIDKLPSNMQIYETGLITAQDLMMS